MNLATNAAPITPMTPGPNFREAGAGPGVVCLHANASASGQWRDLMQRLAPSFHVLAPDLYGSGASPPWPSDRPARLREEVDLIEPVLASAGAPFCLVGHSYGAAVALVAALANPGRVRALAVYEPTLFSLIDAESSAPNEADGIRNVAAAAAAAVEAGDVDGAAELFIDYWAGAGAWRWIPDARKPAILKSVANVGRWAEALLGETTPLSAFAALDIPVLYMVGKRSTPSALGVARLLTGVLPRVEVVAFAALDHMGPVTNPQAVNEAIAGFLEAQTRVDAKGPAAERA